MRSGFFGATVIVTAMVLLPSQAQAVSQDEAAHTCTAAKLKAIAKNAASKLKCEASAFKKQAVLDADCLSKADTKLQDAFTKAELQRGCNSPWYAASVQSNSTTC